MGDDAHGGAFWVEEINGKVQEPMVMRKRRYKKRKKEYDGWGSTELIRFLRSIDFDTAKQITQSQATEIINDYVKQNRLHHPTKKKRIVCDEKLHLLFRRKTISRLKISDLLESHFAENCCQSDDDVFFNSDDDENGLVVRETPRPTPSERRSQPKKLVVEKPRSCFAAIVPFNIKLVYLKRSLVEQLLKDPETFEAKVVGSFIRVKCDPNDYLQKNSHQLLQVTGLKKSSEINGDILLRASGYIRDISIRMLSDDNFTEEECEDLHRRVKDGLLKKFMIVDIEKKARVLHEDVTKHWLGRELVQLENLIDRANEKGWRRELDEYLRKREKLQNPDEQERLLHEVPQVIAEDLESESTATNVKDKKVEKHVQELWQADVPDEKVENDAQEFWQSDDEELWYIDDPNEEVENHVQELQQTDIPDEVVENHVQELRQTDIPDEVENHLQELRQTDIPDEVVENHVQELWQTDFPDEVENHVQELWQTDIPDKKVENHVQTDGKQASLVNGGPQTVADYFLCKAAKLDIANHVKPDTYSPKSILGRSGSSEVPLFNGITNGTLLNSNSHGTAPEHRWSDIPVPPRPEQLNFAQRNGAVQKRPEQQINFGLWNGDFVQRNGTLSKAAESNGVRISHPLPAKLVQPSQPEVIELSDDDDDDDQPIITKQVPPPPPDDILESLLWYYKDPQGVVQGPFSLSALKRWSDASYFSPEFKVWREGQRPNESSLLVNILHHFFSF